MMNSYIIPEKCTHVKLDIGLSWNAPQSGSWLRKEPKLMVFGFEPNPESVERIKKGNHPKKNYSVKSLPLEKKYIDEGRMHIIPVALNNVGTKKNTDFYINSDDCGTSSLYNHDEKELGLIKKVIKVPVVSLKMFFDTFPWDRFEYIDYIKIDAQGSDLNILKGAGDYLKEKVVYVTAEAGGYQYFGAHDCNRKNIKKYMISQNFKLVNHPNTKDPTFLNKKYKHLKKKIYICQR